MIAVRKPITIMLTTKHTQPPAYSNCQQQEKKLLKNQYFIISQDNKARGYHHPTDINATPTQVLTQAPRLPLPLHNKKDKFIYRHRRLITTSHA